MNNPKELPELLTISQAAGILGVHPDTLRNWDAKGILKPVRLGPRQDRRYAKDLIIRISKVGHKPDQAES